MAEKLLGNEFEPDDVTSLVPHLVKFKSCFLRPRGLSGVRLFIYVSRALV